jgi:uncharacterized protein (TIGR03435 family)
MNRQPRRSLTAALLLAGSAVAQAPKVFDVATIKPYAVRDGNFMIRPLPGGKFTAVGVTLKMLAMWAYNVKAFQILGAPRWEGTDLWEIHAQVDGVEGRLPLEDERAMLRALIEDRYRMKLHREMRKMPTYALVALKSAGSKLAAPTASGAGICPCTPSSLAPARASMAMLADELSTILWRRVIDKTGITGEYAFKLEWTPAPGEYGPEALGLPPGSGEEASPTTEYRSPSIFAALKEQLGLRLKPAKGLVQVLVIDHVERPSEN